VLAEFGALALDMTTLSGRAALTGEAQVSGRAPSAPRMTQLLDMLGCDQFVIIPLRHQGEVLGTLNTFGARRRRPTDAEVLALQAVGDLLALALRNARLYADAQRRAREADFLAETARLIVGARTPREILAAVSRQVTAILGDACGILLPQAGRRGIPPAWIVHRDEREGRRMREFLLGQQVTFAEGPLTRRLRAGEVVFLNGRDVLEREHPSAAGRRLLAAFNIHAMLAVGIGGPNEPIGAIVCVRQGPPPYTEENARLLRLVADHTGSALQSAILRSRLEGERARLTAVIEELPEGVILAAAPHSRLVMANRAATDLLGRTVPGEHWPEWAPDFRATTADGQPFPEQELPVGRALRGETVRGIEVWLERSEGRRLAVLASAAPLLGPDGAVREAVVVFQDITAIKEAERVKDQWLSIASHELRTPITSLRGFAQLLERQVRRTEEAPNREALMGALATISQQTNRLTSLVNDLLDVSRIQLGRLELRRRPVDLGELTRTAVTRLAELDPEAGARLHMDLPDRPVPGVWDPDRLDQVLTNLLTNAIKYDPNGGPIEVRLRDDEDQAAVISVSDQGIGVPEAEMAALFLPFARAGNAARRGFGGIGLGLFISRDIVERHGGSIGVQSAEGRGTTVTVRLPRTDCA
jgi:PAS domain S-box-containing protein